MARISETTLVCITYEESHHEICILEIEDPEIRKIVIAEDLGYDADFLRLETWLQNKNCMETSWSIYYEHEWSVRKESIAKYVALLNANGIRLQDVLAIDKRTVYKKHRWD